MLNLCYSTKARLFRNGPVLKIRYYRCAPGAKNMPWPSPVNSLLWMDEPWTKTGVGEVYNPGSNPKRKGETPPTAKGIAPFGSKEDFQLGAIYDPLGNTPRDPWGLAIACAGETIPPLIGGGELDGGGLDRPIVFESGGLLLGGTADFRPAVETVGGLTLGGTVATAGYRAVIGGLTLGGTVAVHFDETSGTMLLGGTIDVRQQQLSGGLIMGGTVYVGKQLVSGGMLLGGPIPVPLYENPFDVLFMGGSAAQGEFQQQSQGGVLLGGKAVYLQAVRGGMRLGGTTDPA